MQTIEQKQQNGSILIVINDSASKGAYLTKLVIDPALQGEILAVQLRSWYNPWSHWTKRITTLSQEPLQPKPLPILRALRWYDLEIRRVKFEKIDGFELLHMLVRSMVSVEKEVK